MEGKVEYQGKCVVIIAQYDTGDPMSYAKVDIYAPDSKIRFQLGRTDRNGCFAFLPDIPGIWRVKVYDGLGHLLRLSIKVDFKNKKLKLYNNKSRIFENYLVRAILGILIIWGILGWFKAFYKIFFRFKSNF
ncbi:MAG: hypothetical protein GXO57_03005 [Thermodesulfobacteria bacterium]|nr:hypothetical protein [Thermodesulfobacteriota bacterium]